MGVHLHSCCGPSRGLDRQCWVHTLPQPQGLLPHWVEGYGSSLPPFSSCGSVPRKSVPVGDISGATCYLHTLEAHRADGQRMELDRAGQMFSLFSRSRGSKIMAAWDEKVKAEVRRPLNHSVWCLKPDSKKHWELCCAEVLKMCPCDRKRENFRLLFALQRLWQPELEPGTPSGSPLWQALGLSSTPALLGISAESQIGGGAART